MTIEINSIIQALNKYKKYISDSESKLESGEIDEYSWTHLYQKNDSYIVLNYCDEDDTCDIFVDFRDSSYLVSVSIHKKSDELNFILSTGIDGDYIIISDIANLCTEESVFMRSTIDENVSIFNHKEYKKLYHASTKTFKVLSEILTEILTEPD